MYFTNQTEYPAWLLRSEHRQTQLANALVVRMRYRIEGRELVPAAPGDALRDIRSDRADYGEYGELPPDDFYPRRGTDLIVLGDAVVQGKPTLATRVDVQAGPYRVALDVYGDRIWEKTAGRLHPSEPLPFSRMPVTFANAFGGLSAGRYGPIPWADNPMGKGYALSKEDALGKALPNVESPLAPIRNWNDCPEVVGLGPYPAGWGLRLKKMVRVNQQAQKIEFLFEEGMFNRAHPLLSGQSIEPGPVRIMGMSAHGAIEFNLPPCPVEMRLVLGEKNYVRDLALEEVIIDLRNEGRFFVDLAYRRMFRYEFVPLMIRHTMVCMRSTPGA